MSISRHAVWLVSLLFLILLISACSNSTKNPVESFDFIPDAVQSDRTELGIFQVNFDLEKNTATVDYDRASMGHMEVSGLLPPPGITLNSYNPSTGVVDVNISILNPYPYTGYDLRLIVYGEKGHKLMNPDGYTILYNHPGSLLNTFMAYAKEVNQRKFSGQTQHTENCLIYLPGLDTNVTLAIDVSFPGNCSEPYSIEPNEIEFDGIYGSTTAEAYLMTEIFDWQDDVIGIQLYCPELISGGFLNGQVVDTNLWKFTLHNDLPQTHGEYPAWIIATSENSGLLQAYERTVIRIKGWARVWGGPTNDQGFETVVDTGGNIYIVGSFEGECDFDPGPGSEIHDAGYGTACYMSMFNPYGDFVWVKTWAYSGSLSDCTCIAQDSDQNIYVGGRFRGYLDFDPGPGEDFHQSTGDNDDCFISKYSAFGEYLYTKTWGGEDFELPYALAADSNGNIFVIGIFYDDIDLDPGTGEDIHISSGYTDGFVLKLNPEGNYSWGRTWGGSDEENCLGLAIDSQNNIYMGGNFSGTSDLNPTGDVDEHISNGSTDAFLIKMFNTSGFNWAKSWGGVEFDSVRNLHIGKTGFIFVAGTFKSTVDFEPDPGGVYEITSNGGHDGYVSSFDANGNWWWANGYGGPGDDSCNDVSHDSHWGHVYITGYFEGTVDFDPYVGEDWHTSQDSIDVFITEVDRYGNYQNWTTTFGGPSVQNVGGIVLDPSDNILVHGYFYSTCDFDPGQGTDWQNTNSSSLDPYLWKLYHFDD